MAEAESERARRCVVTGDRGDPDALIRFVIGPDGAVVPDLEEKLPGRGLWVGAARAVLSRADAKAFSRAARRSVAVPADLVPMVEALLVRRCVDLLALGRRAGEAVSGLEKVTQLAASRPPRVLVTAADAGREGQRRAAALGRSDATASVGCLTGAEIGQAFGRASAVHAAFAPGGLAERFAREAARLAGVRGVSGDATEIGERSRGGP